MIAPAAVRCIDGSLLMRYAALVAYTAAASWTAVTHAGDVAVWLVHGTGAAAGLCALGIALGLASERGRLERRLYGPGIRDRAEEGEEE